MLQLWIKDKRAFIASNILGHILVLATLVHEGIFGLAPAKVALNLYWTKVSVLLLIKNLLIVIVIVSHSDLKVFIERASGAESYVYFIHKFLGCVSVEEIVHSFHLLVDIRIIIEDPCVYLRLGYVNSRLVREALWRVDFLYFHVCLITQSMLSEGFCLVR